MAGSMVDLALRGGVSSNPLWSLLEDAARAAPSRTALVEEGRAVPWEALHHRARRLGGHLQEVGLRPGDRVAALLPNRMAYLEAYFAAAGAGCVLMPLNTRLAPLELRDILAHGGARRLLADPGFAAAVGALRGLGDASPATWVGACVAEDDIPGTDAHLDPEGEGPLLKAVPRAPDDLAHLYYTSGTTGRPKGVMLTHANVLAHARAACRELTLGPDDVWAHIAPLFHLADAWAVFAITAARGRHVMLPRFEPDAALALLEAERVTITNLVPTMLNLMVKSPRAAATDLSSFRIVMSGGAPISRELVRRVLDVFGRDYVQTYGMTETSPYLTLGLLPEPLASLGAEERIGWLARTGRPFEGVDLRVVDDAGHDVPEDGRTVGEIQVRGPTVTPGYWQDPASTRAAFTQDGWFRTGDLAVRVGHGFIDIVDRSKDVILSGGETVYSIEVENAVSAHGDVLEAAAFGIPDPTWGEVVAAALVPRPGHALDLRSLEAFCRTRLAGYKVPKAWRVLDALPRTGSGKIAKRLLRDGWSGP